MTRAKLLNSERLSSLVQQEQLDAVVISSPRNLFYVSGTTIPTHLPIRDRLELGLLVPWEEPVLVLCQHEASLVRQESWVEEIRTYPEFRKLPMHLMAEVIREKGLDRGRLGVEKSYTRAQYLDELAAGLPEATLVGCDDLLDRSRAVKTAGEIERLSRAAKIVEQAIELAAAAAPVAPSERDLAMQMSAEVARLGADGSFQVVAAGPNTAHLFNRASAERLTSGSLVRLQLTGIFDGYAGIAARMATLGAPSAKQRDVYALVAEIQDALIRECRPGANAAAVFATGQRLIEASGAELARPYLGYSFGFGEQERPIIGPAEAWELEPNMVLAVGPFVKARGDHYHVEDLVRITPDGVQRLSERVGPAPLLRIG
jgi:Xaa-Pro dipeptidase